MLCIPKRSSCASSLFTVVWVTTSSSPMMRLASVLNSNSVKMSRMASALTGQTSKSFSSKSIGTSLIIVANDLDIRPCCWKRSTFSFCLPFSSWTFANKPSMEPYFATKAFAVFSPIPGTPGILSEASPHKPKISMT